jgi:hypothetical protein
MKNDLFSLFLPLLLPSTHLFMLLNLCFITRRGEIASDKGKKEQQRQRRKSH